MSGTSFSITGGGSPEILELDTPNVLPTEGDLLYAGQVQRSRILSRTERGEDVDGRPFAGYNTTRPYYYYPNGAAGATRSAGVLKRNKASVKRFAQKVGRTKTAVTRSGLGIRFQSYDAFKHTYLGRNNVDLRGPRAAHMLQELIVRCGASERAGVDRQISIDDHPATATEFTVGIYGQAAIRANGLNSDSRPKGMPRRHFLGSSERDNQALSFVIARRVNQRIRKQIGGGR